MRRMWGGILAGGAVVLLLASSMPADAAAQGATFTFSGGEQGTLKVSSCDVNALGSQFDLHGTLSHTNAAWVLTMDVSKPGTYTHWKVNGPIGTTSVSLDQNGKLWVATKGTLTFGATSGTINVTMKPDDPGAGTKSVKLSGSWNGCT